MRLSAVDGTAFIDFSAANVLTDHIGKRLTIFDSAGKKLIGFIKAAGTGETYGVEKVTNGGFTSDTSGWTPINNAILASVGGGEAGNCLQITEGGGTNPHAKQVFGVVAHTLFLHNVYAKAGSEATVHAAAREHIGNIYHTVIPAQEATGSWVKHGLYGTVKDTGNIEIVLYQFCAIGAGTNLFYDTDSFKQVLTPAATGVTIVSTPGGTVFNWESKEAGFNYNDPAGYEYLITNQRAIFTNHYRQMRAA